MSPELYPLVKLRGTATTVLLALLACGLLPVLTPAPADAQPFGSWKIFDPDTDGFIEVPHDPALDPDQLTLEGWVSLQPESQCKSIIGKHWQQAWWIGHCGETLRSYIAGSSSQRNGGLVADGRWHHFAVTYDGSERCHYVDGVQEACWTDVSGPLPGSTAPVRIGSDVQWDFPPDGAINEIRLWNRALSTEEIREVLKRRITSGQPGLVAVWADGGPDDVVGPHDGSIVGDVFGLTFPIAGAGCVNTETVLCLEDRFEVRVEWRTAGDQGDGKLTPLVSDGSGVFWFFQPDNWELMVKAIDGCPLTGHWWIFSAATTNVFYRMEVFDREGPAQRIFFNYAGPPAPAVTDTQAFDTCP